VLVACLAGALAGSAHGSNGHSFGDDDLDPRLVSTID
jgi:hypothetical protein